MKIPPCLHSSVLESCRNSQESALPAGGGWAEHRPPHCQHKSCWMCSAQLASAGPRSAQTAFRDTTCPAPRRHWPACELVSLRKELFDATLRVALGTGPHFLDFRMRFCHLVTGRNQCSNTNRTVTAWCFTGDSGGFLIIKLNLTINRTALFTSVRNGFKFKR